MKDEIKFIILAPAKYISGSKKIKGQRKTDRERENENESSKIRCSPIATNFLFRSRSEIDRLELPIPIDFGAIARLASATSFPAIVSKASRHSDLLPQLGEYNRYTRMAIEVYL